VTPRPSSRSGGGAAALLGLAALLAAAAAGCAELTRPPPPPPPASLVPGVADPLAAALDDMARDFADRGLSLADRPVEAAEALARLEYLAEALPRDPRYARLAEGTGRELALARGEARDALGVAETAPPGAVIAALAAAAARLRARDPAGAARAMPAPMFRPGGAASVRRLSELGPLPQAAFAGVMARDAVARVNATASGGSTQMNEISAGIGSVTTRLGADLGGGY
jgi:hypothetical protein